MASIRQIILLLLALSATSRARPQSPVEEDAEVESSGDYYDDEYDYNDDSDGFDGKELLINDWF